MAPKSFDFLKVIVDPDDADIDIVAVHGLNPKGNDDHATQTWTAKGQKTTWLEDFLPHQLPKARVMVFSYNSNVAFSSSSAGVREQAIKLLDLLKLQRKHIWKGSYRRPIIFISHSLGGLVVKKALIEAKHDELYNSIRLATYGIAFFATPHHGGKYVEIGEFAASVARAFLGTPDNSFIESLKENSFLNDELVADFRHQLEDFHYLSFYESLPLKPLGIIVTKKSATLGFSSKREKQFSMNADHKSICKFNDEMSTNYKLVIDALIEFVDNALQHRKLYSEAMLNYPSEVQDVKTDPVCLFPYFRNPRFVSREPMFSQIKEAFRDEEVEVNARFRKVAVLCGLGGVGKSQISIAYVHWVRQTFPDKSIFWVHAGSVESFTQGYVEIARNCRIRGVENPEADVLLLVKNWLQQNENWLLVIDNADDVDLFFDVGKEKPWTTTSSPAGRRQQKLRQYIPDSAIGSILLTTKTLEVAHKFGGLFISVPSMNPSESSNLIRQYLPNCDVEAASKLASTLQHLPLALVQAASYIQQNSLNISEYLTSYDESEESAVELLSQRFEDEGRDPQIPNAVATSWILSFNQIKRAKPRAAEILSSMAFFDRQAIPALLLKDAHESESTFNAAIGKLLAYSFVSKDERGYYSLHRLVHVISRLWVEKNGETTKWLRYSRKLLVQQFPQPTKDNLIIDYDHDLFEKYLRHVKIVIQDGIARKSEPYDTDINLLMFVAGRFNYHRTYYAAQQEIEEKHLAYCLSYLGHGTRYLDVLLCLSGLAGAFRHQGHLALSAAMLEFAIRELWKILPRSNVFLVRNVAHLGIILSQQGQHERAEMLERDSLARIEKILGPENSETLLGMRFLSVTVAAQGRFGEAEELLKQALIGQQKVIGPLHPDTLLTMTCLATVMEKRGRHAEAGSMYKEIRTLTDGVLQPDHLQRLSNLASLAAHLARVGDLQEAEAIQREVLSSFERTLAATHPELLRGIDNLAITLYNQGRYQEVEILLRDVLAKREKGLGPGHSETLVSLNFLAGTLEKLSRHEEAQSLLEEVGPREAAQSAASQDQNIPYHLSPAFQLLLSLDLGPHRKRSTAKWLFLPLFSLSNRIRGTSGVGKERNLFAT